MERVGLVLAGGGGKGAYHIGVWKALKEYGVDKNITAVSGTSVGALNAALFSNGRYEIAEKLWLSISHEKLLSLDSDNLSERLINLGLSRIFPIATIALFAEKITLHGIFTRDGLKKMIKESLDLPKISKSEITCYATCCELPSFKTVHFKLNECENSRIVSILLASSALPIIFGAEDIDGKKYLDGGLTHNIPIQPLYDEGYRNLIVAHLGRDEIIDMSAFGDANIIEILPQESQGTFFSGTLDFSPEGAQRRMNQGYEDAIRILKPIYEMGMVEAKIQNTLGMMKDNEQQFKSKRTELLVERKNLKQELNEIIRK